MDRILAQLKNQRGSVFIISLVMMAVITMLGLALFDLGVIENRMVMVNQSDARAFEIAQAGVERALRELLTDIRATESWADGTPASLSLVNYTPFTMVNNTFNGGTYTVELKHLTVLEAGGSPYGQVCLADTLVPANCANMIFVRSTGSVAGPGAYTATRTIQVLAKAEAGNSVFSSGVVAGAPSGAPIQGNIKLAGSIHVIGSAATPGFSVGAAAAGQRNNYADMDAQSLNRIEPLPLVCPPGKTCPPDEKVESLEAKLKVALPTAIPAVVVSPGTLGQSGNTGNYGTPSRKGKGPLDGVYVADGCVMPCTDNFNIGGSGAIYTDDGNLTRPYPHNPLPTFPLLTDPVTINGVDYPHYACPEPPGSCNTGAAFMSTRAPRLDNVQATSCASGPPCPTLGTYFGGTDGLRENTEAFTHNFTFTNGAGTVLNAQMCWKRTGAPTNTLEFAFAIPPTPASCDIPNSGQNPVLIRFQSDFKISAKESPVHTINYTGAAIIVATGMVKIEGILQTQCTTPTLPCPRKFPKDDALTIKSFGNMEIGRNATSIDRIMGLFYTPQDYYQQKQSNLIGSVVANRFCFGGGCGGGGGQVPQFFQVKLDPREVPPESFSVGDGNWSVTIVPRFWKECMGTLPTGVCPY